MRVLFIYRNPKMGFSVGKVFAPIEKEMRKHCEVDSLYMPIANYSLSGIYHNIKAVLAQCKLKEYDIIHITGTEHYLLPFLKRYKTVETLHDLGRFAALSGLRKFRYWLFNIYPLKFADKVVCISKFTESELQNAIKISSSKVEIIADAIDDGFQYIPKKFIQENPVVLHIGVRPHKNLLRTVEALKDVPCHLRIIGSISDTNILDSAGIDYSIASNLTDEELLKEYHNADIINFPSTHEGFGMPIIEGQAIGRAVVTSNIEPMNSVAGNGGASICNPYDINSIRDAYLKIINDDSFRLSIIDNGLNNVENYRLNTITQKYFRLYKVL